MKRKIIRKRKITKITRKHRKNGGGSKGYEVSPYIETKIERLQDEVKPIEKKRFFGTKTENIRFHKVKFGDTTYYINLDPKGKKYEIREGGINNKTIKRSAPIHRILESFITHYTTPTTNAIYHQYLTKSKTHQFTVPNSLGQSNVIEIKNRKNTKKLKSKFTAVPGSNEIAGSESVTQQQSGIKKDTNKNLLEQQLANQQKLTEQQNIIADNQRKIIEAQNAKIAELNKKNAESAIIADRLKAESEEAKKKAAAAATTPPVAPTVAAAPAPATPVVAAAAPAVVAAPTKGGGNPLDTLPPHNKVIVKRRFTGEDDTKEFIVLTLLPSNTSYMSHQAPHFWYRLINDHDKKTQHKVQDITASQILTGYAYMSNKEKRYSGNAIISIYRILDKEKAFKEGIPITDSDDTMEFSIDKKLFKKHTFATDQYPVSQPNFTKKTKLKFILEYPDIEDPTKQYTLIGWSKFKKYMYEDDPMQIRVLGL